MKKRLATLILASAMVLSMAACGNTTSSSKSTTSSKTTSSTTSSKAADSSTTTSSKAADSSTATASTPAESSTPATASTPAESSTPAEASTPADASKPAETSTPAEASTPAETTDSKTTAAEHTLVGLWRSTSPDTATAYYTFYDDGFAILNYAGSGQPTYTYTFENDVLTLDNGETTTVQSCSFDGTALGLKTEGVEFADTYTALVYSPDEGNIVGMWKTVADEPYYYTFHEDGTGHVYQPSRKALSNFDYTIEGDQLKGTITGGDALDFDCTVSFSGDKLDKVLFQYNNGTGQGLSMERVLPENY